MPNQSRANPWPARIAAIIGGLFGIATLFSAGSVLFGPEAARVAAGDFVPFVVWFNLVAGFAYITAALGIWQGRPWAGWLAAGIAGATAIIAIGFAWVTFQGAAFEMRTVGALALRVALWTIIAAIVLRKGRA
jgi:hypothetical protein